MTFYVDNEIDASFPFDVDQTIEHAIKGAITVEKCPYDVQVNVLITDEAGIRDFNRQYREIDRETDVLSFPAVDYDEPNDFSYVEEDPMAYLDPETDELILGDIILCKERIYAQAEEFGHSVLREFTFLVVHSMLHLLGFDHMVKEEEEVMIKEQKRIMEYLDIPR